MDRQGRMERKTKIKSLGTERCKNSDILSIKYLLLLLLILLLLIIIIINIIITEY